MSRRVGIGVVGFGWMGQAHSRSYRNIPVYFPHTDILPELVAVADTVPDRIEMATRNFGFGGGTADWHELLERDDIDVIDITAPTTMHQEVAQAAAAAGKHLFCEKPVGDNPAATAAIEKAARDAGVISGCGYNYRWAPMVQFTKQLIDDGRLGELTHYRGRFFSMYGRDRLGVLSWRFMKEHSQFGSLADIMSHAIDMAHFLVGPIKRVVATKEIFIKERPLPKPGEGTHYDRGAPDDPTGPVTNEDYVGALIEFENGVRGTLEADRSIFGPQSQMAYELNGSRGAAYWDHEKLNQMLLYLPEEQPTDGFVEVLSGGDYFHQAHFVPGGGNSIGYEDLKTIEAFEFMRAILGERESDPSFDAAINVANVMDAMVRSWDSEKWEDVHDLRS